MGWLVEDRFATLLKDHPQIEFLHIYERRRLRFPWNWWRIPGFIWSLRRQKYDVALDLQGNLKSGVLAWLSGAKRRIGLGGALSREGNRWFVKERVVPPDAPHRLDAYYALIDAVTGPGPTAHAFLPTKGERHGSIVLHPGTSAFGAFKRWPAAHFAALGDRLGRKLGAEVVLTAGPGEREQVEEITQLMVSPARIVEPESLGALVDFLAGAKIVVCSDTGPAHLAGAAGVPTVALFGPKDPRVFAPAGPRVRALAAGVRCSPCTLRHCPDPMCMSQLSVDDVERHALELLG